MTSEQLVAWQDLLEMFSDNHVLLHGAAGEDAMNVGDVLKFVRLLRLERMVDYATLQERCNELLKSLQAIRDSEAQSHSWCREVAAHTVDGDVIIWGEE